MPLDRIAIIGAGGWGTALAAMLGAAGKNVVLWSRSEEVRKTIAERGVNERYLPGAPVPDAVVVTTDLKEALTNAGLVIMAVPSLAMREMAARTASHLRAGAAVISAAKGLEEGSQMRMSEVLAAELPPGLRGGIAVLSGPNHAEEVARGLPAATVIAAARAKVAARAAELIASERFRVYTNSDLIGVETGGALKNVIALGAGIADGQGLGDNARAALITRGIVEITRLGTALGARARTFTGLSGLGDLFVTCTSEHSRNRAVGLRLGRGEKLKKILQGMVTVAEGVKTTAAAKLLAARHGVEMPITEAISDVLFDDKPPAEALRDLMTRSLKAESEDIVFKS